MAFFCKFVWSQCKSFLDQSVQCPTYSYIFLFQVQHVICQFNGIMSFVPNSCEFALLKNIDDTLCSRTPATPAPLAPPVPLAPPAPPAPAPPVPAQPCEPAAFVAPRQAEEERAAWHHICWLKHEGIFSMIGWKLSWKSCITSRHRC